MIWTNCNTLGLACQEHTGKHVPSAARETRGNIAQADVPEVKVKGVKMKGMVNSVECLSKVIKIKLKDPLILANWKMSNDLSSQFHSSGK